MDENIVQEILHELFSSLETLETQSAAILQLVKDKGLASEQEIASHLEQAGNAANVRWRTAQVRIEHLINGALKTAERAAKPEAPKLEEKSKESSSSDDGKATRAGQDENEVRNTKQQASDQKPDKNRSSNTGGEEKREPSKQSENEGAKQNEAAAREDDQQNAA